MTISDKLNEIEVRTRELAGEAQTLESEKKVYEGLLECEVNDHTWLLTGAQSSLRHVHFIQIQCEICHCYALFRMDGPNGFSDPLEIYYGDSILAEVIPEEDE